MNDHAQGISVEQTDWAGVLNMDVAYETPGQALDFALIIPTLNAEKELEILLPAIAGQTRPPKRLIIIDSSSTDHTAALAGAAGAEVITINRSDFNHGATRMAAVRAALDAGIVMFLTQDAVPADETSFEQLIRSFSDPEVSLAYGRQLASPIAGHIEAFARIHNYPSNSESRTSLDIERLGFKAVFCSNSFSAYRVADLIAIGGFRSDLILGEDTIAAAKLLQSGKVIVYNADATVYHSHSYTVWQEFKRYFDIGVLHNRNSDFFEGFGKPNKAGASYVKEELRFLVRKKPSLIPSAALRTFAKYAGYRIGKQEKRLPLYMKRRISMTRVFWM